MKSPATVTYRIRASEWRGAYWRFDPALQHAVMIEAVENHMPEVIVIDEIGTEAEAAAARTIAERGVTLIGTAHGQTLENLLMNPTLSDLVGGVSAVTLSDEEARRRGTRKTVLERKAPPTFDVVIEIHDRDRLAIHKNVAEVIDALLRGYQPQPEIRQREASGEVTVVQEADTESMPRLERQHDRVPKSATGRFRFFRTASRATRSSAPSPTCASTPQSRGIGTMPTSSSRSKRSNAKSSRSSNRSPPITCPSIRSRPTRRPRSKAPFLQSRIDRQRRDRLARDRRSDLSSAAQQSGDRVIAADLVHPAHAAPACRAVSLAIAQHRARTKPPGADLQDDQRMGCCAKLRIRTVAADARPTARIPS